MSASGDGSDATKNADEQPPSQQQATATNGAGGPPLGWLMGGPPGAGMLAGSLMGGPGGVVMGGPLPAAMMEDLMAMMGGGGGGPPPPGFAMMTGGGGMGAYPLPPWMNPDGGALTGGASYPPSGAGGAAAGASGGKGGKKNKKGQQTQQGGPSAKRKKRTGSAAANPAEEEPETPIELMTESWQRNVLDKFARCKSAEGIRDTSFFHTTAKGQTMVASASAGSAAGRYSRRLGGTTGASSSGVGNINCLRKLLAELNRMEYEDADQLPGGTAPIWLRYDDETPQYMRAIITGPPRDTPYSNGLFTFDVYVPDSYPNTPPRVQLLTTGGGTVGFSPNLYADGKVCLSLLNTWSGPKWDPGHSSILQILVSIQGLILGVEHPYYMEPGYGGWEASHANKAAAKAAIMNGAGPEHGLGSPVATASGKAKGGKLGNSAAAAAAGAAGAKPATAAKAAGSAIAADAASASSKTNPQNGSSASNVQQFIPLNVRRYEDNIRVGTMKYAVGEYCRDIIQSKSATRAAGARPHYLAAFEDIVWAHFWHRKECIVADGKKWVNSAYSSSQKRLMQSALKSLESVLGQLKAPPSLATETAASDQQKMDTDAAKPSANDDSTSPEEAAKRKEMKAAAAKGDYITAGRIQAELEVSAKVHDMIVARRKEMDDAAEKKDYVTAGKMQLIVLHLERNRRRLQDLERRMFESAAKQDFVKAGKFQEQYRVLLESADAGSGASTPAASASAKGSSALSGGLGGALASALMGGGGGTVHGPYISHVSAAKPATSAYMDDYAEDFYGDHPEDYDDYY